MLKKYRTQFEIDQSDLDIIEKALRSQAIELCRLQLNQSEQGEQESGHTAKLGEGISAIQCVLGKLHNQKIWFVPKETVPLG